jgi:hypothetical protein
LNWPLLGSIRALDSMTVVSLIAAPDEHFGSVVNGDDINASLAIFGLNILHS